MGFPKGAANKRQKKKKKKISPPSAAIQSVPSPGKKCFYPALAPNFSDLIKDTPNKGHAFKPNLSKTIITTWLLVVGAPKIFPA